MTKIKIALILFVYFSVIFILSLNQFQYQNPPPQNFLILGLDPRNDLLEKSETTDTIIYAKISSNFDNIKLFSLPRDLWFFPTSKKINQIYPDSFQNIQNNFSQIIGQNINKTIVITTQNLRDIIDIVSGVDVVIDTELTDNQYPNQDYIDDPKSGAPMYKTIYYPVGINHLNSSNITEFVRSRKSSDLSINGGTDLGRIARQQKLFDAILFKVLDIRNPKQIFALYQYFDSSISHNLNKVDYISLGLKILPNLKTIKLNKINIPTGENPKTDIIFHPQKFINKQWVFITSTPDYQSLKSFISKSLLY
ncbi:MAG: LCP family protein [Candidatus Shapirobacteria bacterium]